MVIKHFNALHEMFNKNRVKLSYSWIDNLSILIMNKNKKLWMEHHFDPPPPMKLCL